MPKSFGNASMVRRLILLAGARDVIGLAGGSRSERLTGATRGPYIAGYQIPWARQTMIGYKHNHYVPIWYQRRFMWPDQHRYHRLDLQPDEVKTGNVKYRRNELHEWSPEHIFAEDDLYTTRWGAISNTDIERFFFGKLDDQAPSALNYFSNFAHPSVDSKSFEILLPYMSVQKLRTPKGLADLATRSKSGHKNLTLILLQEIQNLYCAIWTESVWQIADASQSPTKFIISDHPVTIYNRACPPLSKWCRDHNDPDIRMNASHTYFPLSLNKILILTNLNWVRNPYQNETGIRPNSQLLRNAIFNFLSIQTGRLLSEEEVLQINYITKRRAYRYIAAAEREWLFPEKHLQSDHWKHFGDGYLLMPEPRLIVMGGEIFIGYSGGRSEAYSEYGHRPWQKGYKDKERDKRDSEALYRFQAEWAILKGKKFTANNHDFGRADTAREDSDEMMEHRTALLKKYRKRWWRS